MNKIINEDGSVEGETFSGPNYKGSYPRIQSGDTYADYHERVNKAVENGFHKGDLSWSDWTTYCMGSGQYDGVDSNDKIY